MRERCDLKLTIYVKASSSRRRGREVCRVFGVERCTSTGGGGGYAEFWIGSLGGYRGCLRCQELGWGSFVSVRDMHDGFQ